MAKNILSILAILAATLLMYQSKVIAQTNNTNVSSAEYKNAQNTVSQVLSVQVLCQEPFLNFKATQDCINLEIGKFLPVLDTLDEGLKNQLTPLKDSNKIYTGPLYNQQDLEIVPIQIAPSLNKNSNCQWNYSVLQTVGQPLAKQFTVTFESCGTDVSTYQLLEIKNGAVSSKTSGKFSARTLIIPINQTFYIIS